jgi:CRP-like cAMP-binding protein
VTTSPAKLSSLKDELEKTLTAGKLPRALEIARELQRAEPNESRWAQKAGDILRRQNKPREAAAELEKAARAWAKQGFMARAIAMAKTVVSLDPSKQGLLAELDPAVARDEHRKARPDSAATHGAALTLAQAAPELTQAADAEDDEIRFVMEPSAVIDLSEITLLDDLDLEPLSSAVVVPTPSREIDRLASLPGFPLFAELPQDALALLAEGAELLEVDDGTVVFRRGEHADALYAIVEGAVRIEVPTQPVLREGELFGEACLSGSAKRTADVVAQGRLVALRFSRVLLDGVSAKAPTFERVLVEALGRRVLASANATSRLFSPLTPPERRELGLLFDLRRAVSKFPLLSKGKSSDALYVVISDELVVELASGETRTVGAGGVVGERAVLSPGPSDVTVTAPRGAVVLQLTAAKLTKLAALRPALGKHLATLRIDSNALGADAATVS